MHLTILVPALGLLQCWWGALASLSAHSETDLWVRLSLPLADAAAWAELAVFVNNFKE